MAPEALAHGRIDIDMENPGQRCAALPTLAHFQNLQIKT